MAQSGYTPIVLYTSTTPGVTPSGTNLVTGELGLNAADGKLFYKNSVTTNVTELAGISGYSGYSGGTGTNGTSGYSGYSGAGGTTLSTTDFTATAGQTVFTVTYSPSLLQGVYRNGVKLGLADYTATNGTSITLSTGATVGDLIEVQSFVSNSVIGTSGYSGFSGYSGTNGTSGFSGYSGTNGSAGASGFSGYSGTNGASGTSGYSGSGISGFSGYSGAGAAASIPAGSVLLFYQSSAPTGWTQVTSVNDVALRLVSGTGGTTGGTTAFSTVFANQTPSINVSGLSAGATTLSTAQMPSHSHNLQYSNTGGDVNFGSGCFFGAAVCGAGGFTRNSNGGNYRGNYVQNTGGGGSHTHTISGSASSSAITLNVQYANVIICSKN